VLGFLRKGIGPLQPKATWRCATLVAFFIFLPLSYSNFLAKIEECNLSNLQSEEDYSDERVIPIFNNKVELLKEDLSLQIIPNPARQHTNITYNLPQSSKVQVTAYDVNGQQVATIFSGQQAVGVQQHSFQTENLVGGMYYVVVQTAQKTVSAKMVVLR